MSQVRKTRKGEWWQFRGRSAADVRCAAVMPPAERVWRHGPEELGHQLLRLANAAGECLAMDTRITSVAVHEPQLRLVGYAYVCSLRGICLRLSRHLAFALQRHWRQEVCRSHQRHSRLPPTRHVESDIWAASRHFMATLGAPQPRRSERNTRGNLLSLAPASSAVSTNSLLEDRIRAQHMMRGCAPTRMSEAATTSLATAHMLITNNKQLGERCKEFQQIAKA